MTSPNATPDVIADCVLSTFDSLPPKRKPRDRDLASREWVPLAGIVLSTGTVFRNSPNRIHLSSISRPASYGTAAIR
ncbi:hypothetical protein K490DRAFT_32201 [Saccharata proteae CBS 121410]|uniref:Uncharacterized protein n=1 Tax=Saccharata proteae CBS 121410 TaxID=1314787 RepID=A0A9P4M0D0_9PEZI|nr:hypothetical protein K490DRAFT_32201 [Saccharata proteae CBS 121410]